MFVQIKIMHVLAPPFISLIMQLEMTANTVQSREHNKYVVQTALVTLAPSYVRTPGAGVKVTTTQ